MQTYALLITRVSYYEIEASSPEAVWDAYREADDEPTEKCSDTVGHAVYPADPLGYPTGDPLETEGRAA